MPVPSLRKHVPIRAAVTAGVLGRVDVLLLLMAMGATAIRLLAALAAKELTELALALALVLDELVLPLG